MATIVHDYRFDQFNNIPEPVQITDEIQTIPQNSPYTIRLNEIPQKTTPSTLNITFEDGTPLVEVSAMPSEGQYYPDYYTKADGDDNWNTGTIMFNVADKGKKIKATYLGMGTLVDSRIISKINQELTEKITIVGGAVSNGGYIPVPAGYTRAECRYAVWLSYYQAGRPGSYGGPGGEQCSVNQSTGQINAQIRVIDSDDQREYWTGTTAGYICIAVKTT